MRCLILGRILAFKSSRPRRSIRNRVDSGVKGDICYRGVWRSMYYQIPSMSCCPVAWIFPIHGLGEVCTHFQSISRDWPLQQLIIRRKVKAFAFTNTNSKVQDRRDMRLQCMSKMSGAARVSFVFPFSCQMAFHPFFGDCGGATYGASHD